MKAVNLARFVVFLGGVRVVGDDEEVERPRELHRRPVDEVTSSPRAKR
jgi:hypothetical protein